MKWITINEKKLKEIWNTKKIKCYRINCSILYVLFILQKNSYDEIKIKN